MFPCHQVRASVILPEPAGIHVLALGLKVVLPGALLHADLADALVDARGLYDARSLFDLEGQRLLHVDVLAGVAARRWQ